MIGLLLAIIIAGCGKRQSSAPAISNQSSFLLRFGVNDQTPADWSGSVETTGGRVASLAPWHFDKEDKIGQQANTWTCSTRLGAVLDPKYWWLGALHTIPRDNTLPKAPLIPNGLYITLESAQEARIRTAQGEFTFRPADALLGDPLKFLNGRVEVDRVPVSLSLTAGDTLQDDYPTVAFDSMSNGWAAWIGYQAEKEKLTVARTDGSEKQVVAEGEFFRPSLAAGPDGKLYLAVSAHTGDTWKIGVAVRSGSKWGALEIISAGGPDLSPRAAVDSTGKLWVVWQGYRDGRSRIVARVFDGAWKPELAVSENTRNAWEPAIAADSKGRVHFAWDAYDEGNYNIYYRLYDGQKLAESRRVTRQPLFQAHASVACDRNSRPWISWDEGGANWGKDTGFLIRQNAGEALYVARRPKIAVLTDAEILMATPPSGFLEQAQLVSDKNGNIWSLMRRRSEKLHEVWSQSLQKNRLQQYSMWDYAVFNLSVPGTPRPVTLPFSFGRNDLRAGIAAASSGRLAVVWAGDGRAFSKPYPFVKNEVYTADIPGVPNGEPALTKAELPSKAGPPKPVHPREVEQVAKVRAERIPAGGKQLRILRGDMHRHTDLSFDGDIDGSIWDFYRYTMDVADFDYAALTDHNAGDDNEYFWWIIQKSNDLFHYPGRFTPVYAYERSLRFPNGHRNLVWARRGVKTLPKTKGEEDGVEGAAKLYEYLRKSNGLAMSHTSATLMGTDWRDNDKELEPLVEIYQGDRTSAEYEGAPRAPKGTEPYSQPGGYKPQGFVWNAWAKGFKLGVQASSDHSSTHVSYAVLLAEDTSREGILNAIRARHAYAATDNIILDVRSGDHVQGDIFTAEGRPKIQIRVEGTGPVEKIEVVKNNKFVFSSRPGKASVNVTYEDGEAKAGESYYYVRVMQADGQMAWSSPMWITVTAKPAAR
ncbi:MAG TPA: hypothetical protein VL285_11505 [Bryobacteraceae bacterium]|nr:hypothetical protein [Bryobacteraceae bacterium]